ncbi:MAG: transcriptional regulator [Mucilaginibacter sp.]|nr:transcriptional regulator [Mucilaginibacter sp.]
MRNKWLFLFLLIKCSTAFSQNPIGLPDIKSYSRSDYNAGLQNRSIAQDKSGILYFANSEGLLSYDGTYWKLYPLPNKTIVRSVAIGNDDKVYVGGQNELGYFSPDRNGNLVFTSLKRLLPAKTTSFKDIWDIALFNNKVFFRSLNHLFQFGNKSLTDYQPVSQWQFLGQCNNQLIAQDARNGLFKFTNGKWLKLEIKNQIPENLEMTAVLHLSKDSILITTLKSGMYILANEKLNPFIFKSKDPLLNQLILSAIIMDDGTIAVGTQMGGLYIIDRAGQVVENLTRKEGLQNNTILGLFLDKDRNLWMGLDDGVDFNAYNNAIKHIYPEKLNEGTGYSSILFNNTLYIGTSNGLYELPVNNNKDLSAAKGTFKPVKNTKGPAWGLFKVDNTLLLAHHEGAFNVHDDTAVPIDARFGYWNFNSFTSVFPRSTIIAGNYDGLNLIKYNQNSFVSEGNLSFSESSRFVIIENKTAWVAHNYKGIFKINFSSQGHLITKLYTDKNGLPSLLKNRLFKIKNRMAVATEKGIYEYNETKDRFEPSIYFKNIFKQKDIRYLKEDIQGNVWFIEEKKLGVVDFSGPSPHLIYFPELDGQLVSDFENIYPLNDENIFVGAEKGFYHINYKQYGANQSPIRVLIRSVSASGNTDSILSGGYNAIGATKKNQLHQLSSKQNSLHFEYSAPAFQRQSNIEYSYFLKNFDQGWSAWSKKTEKDYTNLPEGNYTFQVKARSNLGNDSVGSAYSFSVLPPWYRSNWAYIGYVLCFLAFNYLFYRWLKDKFRRQKLKYEVEQKRLNYLYQLELDKSEKEIIALKNEKLELEIIGKNSELAAIAMHLLQKSELLTKIREDLVHLRKSDHEMPSEDLKKLIRILGQESRMDKDWDQFAAYFDTTHGDFLKVIKEKHPLLSAHELKLCAYLKMNLSSKEIAQLLNISVRGVEIGRYRLRKKLQVPTDTNLFNYFTEFSSSKKERLNS